MRRWPFRAVRSCGAHLARVCVIEFRPERVQPAVSIQSAWRGSRGLIRGAREHRALLEDFMADRLDSAGRLVDADAPIVGSDEMRRDVWTVEQHQSVWLAAHPGDRILGWVGNGNLLSNPGFVAGVGGSLFHLRDEPRRFGQATYHALAVWRDRRVTIESLDLSAPLPRDLLCFTTGQRLVQSGQPIDTETLLRDAVSGAYYDLRHLFLFGRIPRGDKRWIDVGPSAFWTPGALENAVRGRPVTADVSQFTAAEIRAAMAEKDYGEVDHPESPGEFSLDGGAMRVVFRAGIYPHNMLGIREDGTVLSVVVSGMSNRAGVTVRGAAALMRDLGAHDAILIDNGGDVMMSFDGRMILGSAEGERNRLRSILLFRCAAGVPLHPLDVRLTVYPGQPCSPLEE